MTLHQVLEAIRYNMAPGTHTFSWCKCKRDSRRGGLPCTVCLKEKLIKMGADSTLVDELLDARHKLAVLVSDIDAIEEVIENTVEVNDAE